MRLLLEAALSVSCGQVGPSQTSESQILTSRPIEYPAQHMNNPTTFDNRKLIVANPSCPPWKRVSV